MSDAHRMKCSAVSLGYLASSYLKDCYLFTWFTLNLVFVILYLKTEWRNVVDLWIWDLLYSVK